MGDVFEAMNRAKRERDASGGTGGDSNQEPQSAFETVDPANCHVYAPGSDVI